VEVQGHHMQIRSDSFGNHARMPAEFAFGKSGDNGEMCVLAGNRNPQLACSDIDVPSKGDDVNKEGRSVPSDLPRVDFAHWLMIDVPATCNAIAAGACSDGITPHGKRSPDGPAGSRQGRNGYSEWFASDPDMA